MKEKIYLSQEGKEQLEKRLEELNLVIIPDAVEKLKTAREFGDLSENAEYTTAKDRLARLTAEKEEIEAKIKFAVAYPTEKNSGDVVSLGVKVKIFNETLKMEATYQLVGTAEADIYSNKIANESAIGKALLGAKKGQTVTYTAPNGKNYSVTILDIIV